MAKNRLTGGIAVALAAAFACALAAASACTHSASRDYCCLEAEKAIAQPAYDGAVAVECRPNSRSENITSNGKYIGKLQKGNTITWYFQAEKAFNTEITLTVANADPESKGFAAGGGKVFSFEVNGSALSVPLFDVEPGTPYSDNWQTVSLGNVALRQGINVAVYTVTGESDGLNVDCISVGTKKGRVEEHTHSWKISSDPATCEEEGKTYKTCDDCGFVYYSETIAALGHAYGNYHYDNDTGRMVSECSRCGGKRTANTPTSRYFGEVYNRSDEYTTRLVELVYEAEDAYVCLDGGLNNPAATSYIEKDGGNMNSPSGGKSIGNISMLGNYILFTVRSTRNCRADLVFRMANVLYSSSGIDELDPMSDYVYCTVNGEAVDFTFVSFPGYGTHSYYEWRYVVIKDIDLTVGDNAIEIGPQDNKQNKITMPNTDVLYVYTDYECLEAVKTYFVNDVERAEYYDGSGKSSAAFVRDGEGRFVFKSGTEIEKADYVLTLSAQRNVDNLSRELTAFINDGSVNFEGIALTRGVNTVILKDVPVARLKNIFQFSGNGDVDVTSLSLYSDEEIIAAPIASVDPSYDYLSNGGDENAATPALIYEAEKADFGNSVSSRAGIDMIEVNIYENSNKQASGNSAVGNFAVKGNTLTWRFTSSAAESADIALMLASANYLSSVGGNSDTVDLSGYIEIIVNGVAVDLESVDLPADNISNYYFWQAVTVKGLVLAEGENVVELRVLGSVAPNADVLYVYSAAELTAIY